MIGFRHKNVIISFVICLFVAFQTLLLFAVDISYCGVISKDEKSLNEAQTGKSVEKALIEQKIQGDNQYQNTVDISKLKSDYYSLLGVTKYANQEAIRNQYIKVGKKYYSQAKANDAKNLRQFNKISEAYFILSNPENKRLYDLNGHAAFANIDFTSINYLTIYQSYFESSEVKYETAKVPTSHKSNVMLDTRLMPVEVSAERDTTYGHPNANSKIEIKAPPQRNKENVPRQEILDSMINGIEDVFVPKSASDNKTVYDSTIEPSAVREEVQSMPEKVEAQSGISATALLKINVENSRREYEAHKSKENEESTSSKRFYDWKTKRYIENVNAPKDENKEGGVASSAQKPIGTQLEHTQLYDNLYDKNRVIAAGGGGGLGEGGGAIRREDYGSGGTNVIITDVFSNMPAEVTISHVSKNDLGNDLVNETIAKAEEEGEHNEAEKGKFAGKKIFELESNGDFGIDNKPEGIDTAKLIMFLGIVGTFILGIFSFSITSNNLKRNQEFF